MESVILAFVNHPKLAAGLAVLAVAFVSAMPEEIPHCAQDWWTWIRSGLQSSIPLHRFPQQPGGPAQPK
jgi:hypothetical protein